MNNYQYWKTDELQHSGVKGMKWGIRKKREPITSKKMGRAERAYRNLSQKTKRLATAAVITEGVAARNAGNNVSRIWQNATAAPNLSQKMKRLATGAAITEGVAARNVVNNVLRVLQNATARPYGSIKNQKATKKGYNVMKNLLPSSL